MIEKRGEKHMGDHEHTGGSREGEYWVIAEKYWDMWGDSWSV